MGKEKDNLKKQKTKRRIMIFIGLAILLLAGITLFNNRDAQIIKSEYKIGEKGYIDDISITLEEVHYINNHSGIELTFNITNERDNTITIMPDDYFVFYDINKVQIPNKYTNDKNIIKKDESITYILQYDVTQKELYEIYFYSQVVENNIKFSFTSSDIENSTINNNTIGIIYLTVKKYSLLDIFFQLQLVKNFVKFFIML